MQEYALRQQLHNEIHARPFERLVAPALVSQRAFLADSAELGASHAHLCDLLRRLHLPQPSDGAAFYTADIGGGVRLRWERHGEFSSYTFVRPGLGEDPASWFVSPACADVPADWLEQIPGQLICANHVALLPELGPDTAWPQPDLDTVLDADATVASDVADGHARVYSDLRIHGDGHARFVVFSREMTPRRRGRLVQRLLEIETYRLLALLALPEARRVGPQLGEAEAELARIMDGIRAGASDRDSLDRLSDLAAEVEGMYARHFARFSASAAYYDLVNRRLIDLHEQQFLGLQTIGQFMERRLAPAMQTCASAIRRLQGLSERVQRCSSLLRTRVEVEVQQQNGEVLASMNRRQYLQLRLQQTVEGLSVAAITYYASSLVGHLAEIAHHWTHQDPDVVQGWSIPVIALVVWLGLRRAHRKLGSH